MMMAGKKMVREKMKTQKTRKKKKKKEKVRPLL